MSLVSKVDELIRQMDSCSKERRGQEFGFDQLSRREAKIILAFIKYIKEVYIGRKGILKINVNDNDTTANRY